eukprot:10010367-Alexandrium_andersonii.AAC.1
MARGAHPRGRGSLSAGQEAVPVHPVSILQHKGRAASLNGDGCLDPARGRLPWGLWERLGAPSRE